VGTWFIERLAHAAEDEAAIHEMLPVVGSDRRDLFTPLRPLW
jgi:hypothetical protein